MVNKISIDKWMDCQAYERKDWGSDIYLVPENREVQKQVHYASLMKLSKDLNYQHIDLSQKSVLDVGCGPVSMLLRSSNFKRAVGVEPLDYGKDVDEAYKSKNVDLLKIPAEKMNFKNQEFDEVWMYNVLQHVYDPLLVLEKIMKSGKTLRIFEWVDIAPHEGHPHELTEDLFVENLDLKKEDFFIKDFAKGETPYMHGKAIVVNKVYD